MNRWFACAHFPEKQESSKLPNFRSGFTVGFLHVHTFLKSRKVPNFLIFVVVYSRFQGISHLANADTTIMM